MDSFEFESGRVLENVAVEFSTRGVPKYDDEGNITNAIVYCPTLRGGYSIFDQNHEFINSFDIVDNYFFIKILSLGAPDSCSPSSTNLFYNFPSYTFRDRVNFKKQFLSEKFNIDEVLGIIGEGLGGFEAYTWACEYPDDMEFIVTLNSSFKTYGYRYVFLKCIESIFESSDDIYSETYSASLSKMSVSIFRLLFAGYFPKKVLENLTADEIDVIMEDYVDEALFMDIHDFKCRNECILGYNVEDKLSNIKAKSLIMGIRGFLLLNPEKDIIPLQHMIKDSKVRVYDSKKTDYYEEEDYSDLIKELLLFLKEFKK